MDQCVHFWWTWGAMENFLELLVFVGFVRIDVLSDTLWSVVTFEIHLLTQALFEEEIQRSFASSFGRRAFTSGYSIIFPFELSQIVINVIFIEVRLVGEPFKKLLDVRLVRINGACTFPGQFRLPLSKLTRAIVPHFFLAYLILECYSTTDLPFDSSSKSGYCMWLFVSIRLPAEDMVLRVLDNPFSLSCWISS